VATLAERALALLIFLSGTLNTRYKVGWKKNHFQRQV